MTAKFLKICKKHGLSSLLLAVSVSIYGGCGTVVGNPKKPPKETTDNVNPIVYEIPLIDFSMPDSATSDDTSSLLLAAADTNQNQKAILISWSKRADLFIRQIDRLSGRLNKIVSDERETNKDDVLVFSGKGNEGRLSGKIQKIDGDTYSYQAVLCHNGSIVSQMQWNDDGTKLEVTRNFSKQVEQEDTATDVTTRVTVEKTSSTTIEFHTYGTSQGDLPNEAGTGFVEHAVLLKDSDGIVAIRSVADYYKEAPADNIFDANYYLTGRMVPNTDGSAKAYNLEFVGYYAGYPLVCKNGFDEDAADLWAPDFTGPRFCIGRPLGKKQFASSAEFLDTVAGLASNGILSKTTLAPVSFDESLSCE